MKKQVYKKWWFWVVIIAVLGAIIGTGSDTENPELKPETQEILTDDPELNRKEALGVRIEEIVDSEYNRTDVKSISINENLGTDTEDDYIVLVYLSFTAQNRAKTAREMVDLYSSDLAARLAEEKDISEVAIFWEVPYLKKDDNIVKFNLQRLGDGMEFKEKWYDDNIF